MPWYQVILLGLAVWLTIGGVLAYVLGQVIARR
jgi:hypothetical protein